MLTHEVHSVSICTFVPKKKKQVHVSTYARDELGRERSGDVCVDKEEERAQLGACDAQMRRRARVLGIGAQFH